MEAVLVDGPVFAVWAVWVVHVPRSVGVTVIQQITLGSCFIEPMIVRDELFRGV